ncbi:ATP-binding protein [Magnetococcales bacterium HHB-1]
MRLGVRGKLFLLSLLLIVGVVVAAGIFLEYRLSERLEARAVSELLRHAKSARVLLNTFRDTPTIESIDLLADQLSEATAVRITFIDEDGSILGDSRLSPIEILPVENHGTRPEVVEAQKNYVGHSKRYSTTLRTTMMFVAIPFEWPTGRKGTVRTAMSLEDVEKAKVNQRLLLFAAGMFALFIAISISGLNAHLATRTLRALVDHVRLNFEHPRQEGKKTGLIPPTKKSRKANQNPPALFTHDEIGGLAGSFNRMAKKLENAVATLAEERDRIQTVLESMGEGVLALDKKGGVNLANQSALNFLQLSPPPPIGTKLKDLVHQENEKAFFQVIENLPLPGQTEVDFPSHPPKRFYIQKTPTGTQEGCCVIVLRDITEIHRQEQIRRDFVANVSHELRTPVSIILANIETLLDGAAHEDQDFSRTLMQAVERHALRLSRLISDLLDLSRIEYGQHELCPEKVSIKSAVARVIEEVSPLSSDKNISIHNHVEDNLAALADPGALEQILFNLLDNATKYTPNGGRIIVRAWQQTHMIRIEVEDNGFGIEPKHHPRLYERFYRVDPGRNHNDGSTGLGLPIVKRLVQTMGGKTAFESIQPHGSLFWFTIPAHQEERA